MKRRDRQAETCKNSFFDRDYLASIEQAYADWLEPSAAAVLNDKLYAELVVDTELAYKRGYLTREHYEHLTVEVGRVTRIENMVQQEPLWTKKTVIIKTHDLNADQVYTLFENQLVHIISMTAPSRREHR